VSKVFPDAASTHSPSMKSFRVVVVKSLTLASIVTVMAAHLLCWVK